MEITTAKLSDVPIVVEMSKILYQEENGDMLIQELKGLIESEKDAIFVAKIETKIVGFLHMSIRNDYVEGVHTYPVAYMEGIYVKSDFRHQSVAKHLVEAGSIWAKAKNCQEIASDAELENIASHKFHKEIGFKEVNRTVNFIKKVE